MTREKRVKASTFKAEKSIWFDVTISSFQKISGFRREVDEHCALMGYYEARSGNCLATFRYNISVPSSMVKIIDP